MTFVPILSTLLSWSWHLRMNSPLQFPMTITSVFVQLATLCGTSSGGNATANIVWLLSCGIQRGQ